MGYPASPPVPISNGIFRKIPDRAVIHEAVEIAKNRGHKGIASFVNGVLRSIQREGVPSFDAIEDPVLRLATETSHPEWLVKEWADAYGFDAAEKICRIHLIPPKQTLRINQMKTDRAEILDQMAAEGIEAEKGDLAEDAVKLVKGTIAGTHFFQTGEVSIQDESSMLVARALDPKPGETVLDACAAPGGKSAHIAELMENKGSVTSLDLHKHKVKLIKEASERLGLSIIDAKTMDARKAGETFKSKQFDRILVDAPCSGFGVIRRKPDMKYTKTPNDSSRLAEIQLSILREIAPLVKKVALLSTVRVQWIGQKMKKLSMLLYKNILILNPICLLKSGCPKRRDPLFGMGGFKSFRIISEQMVSLFAA